MHSNICFTVFAAPHRRTEVCPVLCNGMTEQDQSAFILHSNWPVETKRGNIEYCRICTSISAFESVRYLCVIIFQIAMLQAIHLIFHSAYMIAIISLDILPMYKDHPKYAIQIIYRRCDTIFLFFYRYHIGLRGI